MKTIIREIQIDGNEIVYPKSLEDIGSIFSRADKKVYFLMEKGGNQCNMTFRADDDGEGLVVYGSSLGFIEGFLSYVNDVGEEK